MTITLGVWWQFRPQQGSTGLNQASLTFHSIHAMHPSQLSDRAHLSRAPCHAPSPQGFILSGPGWDAQAYVFALFDEHQKLQYVGFSRDLKNSLRTLFSRRPEKAHYFK